jgi:hypothetical protein
MVSVAENPKKREAKIQRPAADRDTEIYDPDAQSIQKKPAAACTKPDPRLQCDVMFHMDYMNEGEFEDAIASSRYVKHMSEEEEKNYHGPKPTKAVLYEASKAKWKDVDEEKKIKKKPAAAVDQEGSGWINYEGVPMDRMLDVADLTT